jgi:hypothetical protein
LVRISSDVLEYPATSFLPDIPHCVDDHLQVFVSVGSTLSQYRTPPAAQRSGLLNRRLDVEFKGNFLPNCLCIRTFGHHVQVCFSIGAAEGADRVGMSTMVSYAIRRWEPCLQKQPDEEAAFVFNLCLPDAPPKSILDCPPGIARCGPSLPSRNHLP